MARQKSPIILAIHHRPGSFSDRWIQKCEERQIKYRIVNGYDTNIIKLLSGVDAFLWHWATMVDMLCARRIIEAADYLNIKIFPNRLTCWFYDDKIAEKYVLEAVESPLVTTYVFYTLPDALEWIRSAVFPKVFKLSRGAGSSHVRLVRQSRQSVELQDSDSPEVILHRRVQLDVRV